VKLQRELGMPRAGSEQQLRWAQAWTARMGASAPEVIVSHPRQQGDEALRPSALIAHVPAGEAGTLMASQVPGDAQCVHMAAPAMETLDDQVAPAVDASRPVHGGVSVFKDQAACPFRAFAIHRLGARDVAAPDSSLNPRVRGNLAHRLLELLWQALGGQSRMLAMSQQERTQLIRDTAGRVLADEARQRPHTLRGRLLAMEQKRLERLADAWLDMEAGRAPFEVEAEHSESSTVAGLPVTLRPDRVDRLDGGELFLVDYKTGRCNPKDWFGERPDEPQLPVYMQALDDLGGARVAGLAFGVLRPGELGYRGLGDGDEIAPGVSSVASSRLHGARQARDWEAHKLLWRQRLERLARAYLEGDARVDPKLPGTTCRYCGLQLLCRVHEQ
jgi:probable DNA repair protein